MMQIIRLVVLTLLFLQVSLVFADDSCDQWSAKITSMQGIVEIQRNTTLTWLPAKLNDSICILDILRTAPRSRVTIQIQEEGFVKLQERTIVRFSSNQKNENGIFSQLLNLFSGEAFIRSRRPHEFGMGTPFVNVMHRGTEFLVKVNQESTQVIVFDGVVVASNKLGEVSLSKGQSALTMKGQAPVIGPRIELRDAVQWTLYYPPVIDYTAISQNASYMTLKPALDRFKSNDLVGAFEQLDKMSEVERNADYQILYASLLLTVGQVEEAQQHLNQVPQASQQNANVLVLQSIIALATNEQQQALKLAKQALIINPEAAAPKIALSYVSQSLFDIDKALDSAREAVQADPNNALAWARVSEMELATGNIDASMEAASKAQTLNPQLSKTNTVLGFVRLASLDLSDAEQSFRDAIKRDPSDPLARLGLGLAKIRQGHVKSGTKEIETAANLDPDNALIRSYLGKAYYEQKRGDIASTEYGIAKKLDPKDPTPWFYDAIYKQTVNRPVEALHDMQKAIELNDNRAVFRSSLLLDEDLAARSSSLGRIYNDLGFQQRGLLEGWKSVNSDPGNYSAHRLLADNYRALPGHEIARVSELLQSQLLQPINITPVQPQLAESDLLILDGLGSSSASFNEFNPLFARNRSNIQASGVYGNNNTWGNEITHAGLWNKFSYSLGQFHYETDGFRENNDLYQNVFNAFGQYVISNNLNIQMEYRYKEVVSGDRQSRFDLNNFSKQSRESFRRNSGRLGINYKIDNTSNILLSTIYNDDEYDFNDKFDFDNSGFSDTIQSKSFSGEVQYIKKFDWTRFILGGGYAKQSFTDEISFKIDIFSLVSSFDQDANYVRSYFYSYWSLNEVEAILGISYDGLKGHDGTDRNRINPKAGFIWDILDSTTLRFAYVESVSRLSFTSQTLEPTQVAGFNQFFDEKEGTISRRVGIGLDQKFNQSLYGGIEVSYRTLYIPRSFILLNGEENMPFENRDDERQSETLARSYLYWTPISSVTLSAEYFLEIRDRDLDEFSFSPIPSDLTTHQVPLTISYFSSTGFYAKARTTFVKQNVKFASTSDRSDNYGSENFVTLDTILGYRLPKRSGVFEFGIRNILDERYQFANINLGFPEPDLVNFRTSSSRFAPERTIFGRFILNLDF